LHSEIRKTGPRDVNTTPNSEKKPTKRIWKYSKDKIYQDVQREKMTTGFNLLTECVPGTKKVPGKRLNRPDMLMKTVNYIKELQNKIKELEKESLKESTPLTECKTGMGRDSVPKITLHRYNSTGTEQDCTDSAPRKPPMPEITSSPMETDISEPEVADPTVKTFTSTPTGASDEKSSRETSCAMDDHSTETVLSTSEEIPESVIVSPEEEEELLASPDEEEEEELPEFNSVEDLRQWLGV
jgi:hypothetical protein